MKIAIATTSELAATAGAAIAESGGNAVDTAIAAALVSINTEPGVCSLGCGGYITVWGNGAPPVTLDGYVAAPGKGIDADPAGRASTAVHLEYGGGITTVVGPDTVGVPGGIAAFGTASERFGRLPWQVLLEPAIDISRRGFPLPKASRDYLVFSGKPIFGRADDGFNALHDDAGQLKNVGDKVKVPYLADTLEAIAKNGPAEFYSGDIGRAMADYTMASGGRMSHEDLNSYSTVTRDSLLVTTGSWHIATNPPPAVGGSVLTAMMELMSRNPISCWDDSALDRLVKVQRAVLGYRRECMDHSTRLAEDAACLLELSAIGNLQQIMEAGSTCHTSAVDDTGLGCSITMSAGYGSGDMPPGTGIWLNNCLGELELNKHGLDIGPPGCRLPSNMAPSVARSDENKVLAVGSPGADRITTAILQTLVNHLLLNMPLDDAVRHPRAHVEFTAGGYRVAYEPGIGIDRLPVAQRAFESLSMYFGGVGAASWSATDGLCVAADPRRTGGIWHSATG